MLVAHKIRLNPTTDQETYFKKASGIARKSRNNGKKKSLKEIKNSLNANKKGSFPWMYEVTKCAAEYSFLDLQKAFNNYYKNKRHFKFPTFKTKKRSPMKFGVDNCNFSVCGHELTLPKIEKTVNMAEKLRFEGKLMACRISYKAGHWYATITVEVERENKPAKLNGGVPLKEKTIGIDLGIKTLATLSNGQKFENQKHLGHAQQKVKRLNRKLSRSKPGGKNREKVVLALSKAYERVTNLRTNQYYNVVTEILKGDYELIGVENLNVQGMLRNRKLAKQIADVAFGTFKQILTYKAERLGVTVIEVGRFYPSTQICHDCHYQNKALILSYREWACPQCGKHQDRDVNAAINIDEEAVRLYLKGVADAQKQSVTAVVTPDVKCLSDRA
jgi:putative transposase